MQFINGLLMKLKYMLSKEQLNAAIEHINKLWQIQDVLNSVGIDFIDSDLFDIPNALFTQLIESNYTEEGVDLIIWWVYENECGHNNLEVFEDNEPVCKTFDELFDLIEQYKK